jgi:hypothetical protein
LIFGLQKVENTGFTNELLEFVDDVVDGVSREHINYVRKFFEKNGAGRPNN